MVIVSDDVRNVVNRIFLIGIAYKGRIPNMYGQIISAFEKLESSVANVNASSVNSVPFAWRRDKMLVLRVGSLMFSYTKTIQQNGEIKETVEQYLKRNLI